MKKYASFLLAFVLLALAACNTPHTHSYGEWEKVDDTNHKHVCECGEVETVAHTWDSGEVLTAATHLAEGEKKYTCTDCQATKVEAIAKTTEHSYGEWEKVDAENHKHSCECGEVETVAHTWDTGEVTKAATHLAKGEKTYTCESCSETKVEEIEKTTEHSYGGWVVDTAASSTTEGLEKRECACESVETRKVLKTPVLNAENDVLSWAEVQSATGYKVYCNGELLSDVGAALTYKIVNLSSEKNVYTVEAYTTAEGYRSDSEKSNSKTIYYTYGTNNLSKGDLESTIIESVIPNDSTWYNGFLNNNTGITKVVNINNNYVCEMRPTTARNDVILTMPVGSNTLGAGTYRVYIDVYKGSAADGELFIGICDQNLWHFGNLTVAIPAADSNGWSTVMYEYTITNATTGDWANFDLGYRSSTIDENDYIYVDNFRIVKVDGTTETRVDNATQADFEGFGTDSKLNQSGWKANETIYVEASSLENELVVDGDNTYLKLYTSSKALIEFDLFAGDGFTQDGVYLVSMKAKLGAGATNMGNIGFRFWGDPRPTVNDYEFNKEGINSEEWVTISTYVTITNFQTPAWVNMFFWVFTNNDTVNSADNYVLIDDISIQLQSVVVE